MGIEYRNKNFILIWIQFCTGFVEWVLLIMAEDLKKHWIVLQIMHKDTIDRDTELHGGREKFRGRKSLGGGKSLGEEED